MSIKGMMPEERPRERLLNRGAKALSDVELLAILLRTGHQGRDVLELSRTLIQHFGSLSSVLHAPMHELMQRPGMGPARYAELKAVVELAERHYLEEVQRQGVLCDPAATRKFLTSWLRHRTQEVFACLFLDTQNRIISAREMFFGTIDCASVHPREVVRVCLHYNAAAVIVAHNHPSGIAEPSGADRQITETLQRALRLVDVRLLDHVVIGGSQSISLAERGWMLPG